MHTNEPASTSIKEEMLNLSQLFSFVALNYINFSEIQLQEPLTRWPLLEEISKLQK